MTNDNKYLSTEKEIFKSIRNNKTGKIFFPSHFSKHGSPAAVRKSLSRLEKEGVLIRLARGIYLYPKKHETLGLIQPTLDEIAEAISKRDRARIFPTGVQAMNKLGLTSQVPLKAVYLTDGSPRTLQIGNRRIKFKKASAKILGVKNELLALIFLAMAEIGQDQIDSEIRGKIKDLIAKVDRKELGYDIKRAPQWIAEIIKDLAK